MRAFSGKRRSAMAASSDSVRKLDLTTEKTAIETIVHCTGRITSDTAQSLKMTVKPLLSESKIVVLDMQNVNYMDSTGLGTIVGLAVSAKTASCQLKLTNLNKLVKDLFSITRLGEVMAQGRDANDWGIP
jgi:anti-sigma B factor antagonist